MTPKDYAILSMYALDWNRLHVTTQKLKAERKAAFKKCCCFDIDPDYERPGELCFRYLPMAEWCDQCVEGDSLSRKIHIFSRRTGTALTKFRRFMKSLDKKEERGE